jgi:hypothetical protein
MKKILAILLLALPLAAQAHGVGGTYEQNVDGLFIDIGWDTPIIRAQTPVRYDYNLYLNNTDYQEADYDTVWVRIMQGTTLIFATNIPKQSFGLPGMTFTFPAVGEYDLTVQFLKDSEKVRELSYTQPVQEPLAPAARSNYFDNPFVSFVIGLAAGILIQLVMGLAMRARKKKRPEANPQ